MATTEKCHESLCTKNLDTGACVQQTQALRGCDLQGVLSGEWGWHLANEGLGGGGLAVHEEVTGIRPLVQDDVVAVLVRHHLLREGLRYALAHLSL